MLIETASIAFLIAVVIMFGWACIWLYKKGNRQ